MNDFQIKWPFVIIGVMAGWIISGYIGDESEMKETCNHINFQTWAIQQCLSQRPACHVSDEGIRYYHKLKGIAAERCPANNGDGFLSYPIESK